MFLKKLQKFIAIILTFLSFSFNLNAQISDNFLLLYESYEKLNNIEQVIQKSEKRIYRKYGVSETLIQDKNLKIQPTEHFIGYQIKKFNDLRLIELKFNKDSISNHCQGAIIIIVGADKNIRRYRISHVEPD